MNCHRISRTLALATVGAMVAVPLAAQDTAEETRSWLHVQVESQGDEGERMALNLPLRAIGAVMAMAPDEIITSDGRLTVAEEHGVSVSDIRTMWQEFMVVGDTEFVAIEHDDRTVRIARAGERIEIRVEGEDENVRVDLPIVVVDALLSGEGDTLNIAAAIDQLGGLRGDIILVTEEERQIRVWVDETAEE